MLTQAEVESAIVAVAARLPGVRPDQIPDGVNRDAGYPFVRVEDGLLVYLAYERGREILRKETSDLDELLWFVFHDVTRQLATKWELAHRGFRRKDSRRLWFPRWVLLMTELKPEWGADPSPCRRGARCLPLPRPLSALSPGFRSRVP